MFVAYIPPSVSKIKHILLITFPAIYGAVLFWWLYEYVYFILLILLSSEK